jgi:hypothetical protein
MSLPVPRTPNSIFLEESIYGYPLAGGLFHSLRSCEAMTDNSIIKQLRELIEAAREHLKHLEWRLAELERRAHDQRPETD